MLHVRSLHPPPPVHCGICSYAGRSRRRKYFLNLLFQGKKRSLLKVSLRKSACESSRGGDSNGSDEHVCVRARTCLGMHRVDRRGVSAPFGKTKTLCELPCPPLPKLRWTRVQSSSWHEPSALTTRTPATCSPCRWSTTVRHGALTTFQNVLMRKN